MADVNDMAVLGRSRPKISLLDFEREQVLVFLRERLEKHKVEEAYLFGSLAIGEVTAWSDIDLIIIKECSEPFVDRPRAFFDLFDLGIPIDLLIYTPEEWTILQCGDSGFWKKVKTQLLKII